jgi:hypothetical protein
MWMDVRRVALKPSRFLPHLAKPTSPSNLFTSALGAGWNEHGEPEDRLVFGPPSRLFVVLSKFRS